MKLFMNRIMMLAIFSNTNLYEYMSSFKKNNQSIPEHKIKNIVFQIIAGINYLHQHGIIHRDLKPENILMMNDSNLIKIADFGVAKETSYNGIPMTDYVCTRWYRAPECVLKSTSYSYSIDVWAIGCIMGELADGNPLFPGENETDQLHCIQKVLGNLPEDQVEMFYKNPLYNGNKLLDVQKPETLEKRYMGKLSKVAINFMKGFSKNKSETPIGLCRMNIKKGE